jgi:tetratricopeptide (TPR) repeat protein
MRDWGDLAAEAGDSAEAGHFYEEAAVLYDKAFMFYYEADDPVRASAAMLDKGVLALRQGDAGRAVKEITESIRFLLDHVDEEPDKKFIQEHLAIKRARLAEAALETGDVSGARDAIARAKDTPQRNPYFVMVTTEIEGYVYRAENNFEAAREQLTQAALSADAQGDTVHKRRILDALDTLRAA